MQQGFGSISLSMWLALGGLGLLSSACGGESSPSADGGPAGVDGGGQDAAGGLPTTCTGACATVDLTAVFGSATRSFTRGFFGLTSPAKADSGDWEIYIEASAGGDDACPSDQSATPDYLLIASGLAVPGDAPAPVTATVNLVDFEGALLPSTPVEAAASNTITWAAADPCVACAEGSEPDRSSRFVAVEVMATFAAGSASGHVYATHCSSLDDL